MNGQILNIGATNKQSGNKIYCANVDLARRFSGEVIFETIVDVI